MVNKISANPKSENITEKPKNKDNNRFGDFSAELNDARGRFAKKRKESDSIDTFPSGIFSLSSILYKQNDVETADQLQLDSQVANRKEHLQTENPGNDNVGKATNRETAEKDSYQDALNAFMSQIIKPEMLLPIRPELVIQIPPNMPIEIDKFSSDIAQKVSEMKGKFDEVNIALKPKELGNVNLTIKIVDGKVNISIAVDAKQREFFDDNLAQLSESLDGQNIAIGELSVSVNSGYGHNPFDDFKNEDSEANEAEMNSSLQHKIPEMYRHFKDNQVYHSV